MFTATEADGAFIEVCAIVANPPLQRNAVVTLQSADGTATCELRLCSYLSVMSYQMPIF